MIFFVRGKRAKIVIKGCDRKGFTKSFVNTAVGELS